MGVKISVETTVFQSGIFNRGSKACAVISYLDIGVVKSQVFDSCAVKIDEETKACRIVFIIFVKT